MRARAWAVLAVLGACGRSSASDGAAEGDVLAAIDFRDGARVLVRSSAPDPAVPGEPVTLSLALQGPAATLRVGLWPPRVGGRELVQGSGIERADLQRPDDERVVLHEVPAASGALELTLALPQPWHPRTAMVTLERFDGDGRIEAIAGPRTRDGLGTAALLRVATTPTAAAAVRTAVPVAIDGVLDDAAWAGAPALRLVESLDGEPASPRTVAQLAWDEDALYLAVTADDDDVWSEYTRRDEPLWKQEAIELFLFGDASRQRYLELQLSPRGVAFDARFERYRKGDEAWNGSWHGAATVEGTVDRRDDRDRRVVVELAVPFAEICAHTATRCPPQPGDVLRINVFRLDRPRRGNPVALSLSPTRVSDFHAPENAATLELLP
ncbi:MAG: carbohydrate-binding family 9-like protein [Nannocystaceae bacterium]|nr:carbohydrate-binding family 9-like protein [Nannocystaceae bacterium]